MKMYLNQTFVKFAIKHPHLRFLYRVWISLSSRAIILSVVLVLCAVFIVLLIEQPMIIAHLRDLDTAVLYQLSISVGAALIGLIAVVFTLSLFVIQQISNTSIPGLLGEYASDRIAQLIYLMLALFALVALGSSLIATACHPFLQVSLIAICVVGSFILLWLLFERVAILCDPSNVIKHIRVAGRRELEAIEDLRQAILEANPVLARAKVRIDQDAQTIPLALAQIRHYNPSLTLKFERGLRRLYTLLRSFASQQQHDLFAEAVAATTDLLQQYLEMHGRNLTMANTATYIMGIDAGFDRILSNALDVYAAVAQTSASTKDNEMAKAVMQGLATVAIQSVSRPPLNSPHGENPTTALIVGTMTKSVKNFVVSGHIEGTFAAFDLFIPVGTALTEACFYLTAMNFITSVSELAQLCVVAKQPILATRGTRTLLHLLASSISQDNVVGDIPGAATDEIFAVCRMEIEDAQQGTHPRPIDIGASQPISKVLSVSEDSLVGIHQSLSDAIFEALESGDEAKWSHLSHIMENFHEKLPWRLVDLGERSASKDQFTLFYLDETAYSISTQIISLWKKHADFLQAHGGPPDGAGQTREAAMRDYRYRSFRDKLKENLGFLVVFFYSRCRKFQAQGIHSDRVRDCFQSAVGIANDATFLGMEGETVEIVRMLGGTALAALNEQGFLAVRTTCILSSGLIDTSLVAQTKQDTATQEAVERVLEQVYKKALQLTILEQEKHTGLWVNDPRELLLMSLSEFINGERHLLFENKSITFARTVNHELATAYLGQLEQRLDQWTGDIRIPPPQ
jgi:hypothetical protein